MGNKVKDILKLIKERDVSRDKSSSMIRNIMMERLLLDNNSQLCVPQLAKNEK